MKAILDGEGFYIIMYRLALLFVIFGSPRREGHEIRNAYESNELTSVSGALLPLVPLFCDLFPWSRIYSRALLPFENRKRHFVL